MPGDYLFPKRRLKSTGDVLDPTELNQSIQPAAERLNGHLNQHNIKAPVSSTIGIDTSVFANPYYAYKAVASGVGYLTPPDSADADRFTLFGESSWKAVDGAVVSLTTGTSMLSVWASAWYSYQFADTGLTFDYTGNTRFVRSNDGSIVTYNRAAVQFALRVDGTVIPETITGRVDTEQAPFYPYRVYGPRLREDRDGDGSVDAGDEWPATPITSYAPVINATANPRRGGRVGPQSRRLDKTPHGMNCPSFPFRIGYTIMVEPGGHTVELVARRIANRHEQTNFISKIEVYSRQLLVLDHPFEVAGSVTSLTSPVTVPEFQPEDIVSASALETDRISPIEVSTNAVEAAQIARGSLTSDHIGGRKMILASARAVAGDMAGGGDLSPDGLTNRTTMLTMNSDPAALGAQISGAGTEGLWHNFAVHNSPTGRVLSTAAPYAEVHSASAWDAGLMGVNLDARVSGLSTISSPTMIVRLSSTGGGLFSGTGVSTATHKMRLVVIANVELVYLGAPALAPLTTGTPALNQQLPQAFAAFGIAVRFVGDGTDEYYVYTPSEVAINCANYYDGNDSDSAVDMRNVSTLPVSPYTMYDDSGNMQSEVPLIAYFDLSDERSGTDNIADIAVIGGVGGKIAGTAYNVRAVVNRASIFAFAIDAGDS
jgi:hypothetical protein